MCVWGGGAWGSRIKYAYYFLSLSLTTQTLLYLRAYLLPLLAEAEKLRTAPTAALRMASRTIALTGEAGPPPPPPPLLLLLHRTQWRHSSWSWRWRLGCGWAQQRHGAWVLCWVTGPALPCSLGWQGRQRRGVEWRGGRGWQRIRGGAEGRQRWACHGRGARSRPARHGALWQ